MLNGGNTDGQADAGRMSRSVTSSTSDYPGPYGHQSGEREGATQQRHGCAQSPVPSSGVTDRSYDDQRVGQRLRLRILMNQKDLPERAVKQRSTRVFSDKAERRGF